MKSSMFRLMGFAAVALVAFCAGCTSRGLTVTSEPPGAEVSINYRVIGKTPIRVGFNHYGTYRIELRKDGYKVLVREEPVNPPIYGYDPITVVADNIVPARLNDEVYLHYALKPSELKDDKDSLTERDALMERAVAARSGTVTHPQSGEIVQVKLDRIPTAAPGELATAQNTDDDIIRKKDPNSGASGETPLIAQKSDTIKDKPSLERPKEPSLAQQFGIDVPPPPTPAPGTPGAPAAAGTATPDTRGAFVSPDAAKVAAPKVIRTPKDELLIYQAPKIEKKEEKSDKDKKDDAKEPVPSGPERPQKAASN